MKAHVGRVLAALTVDELYEVRDRMDGFVENATHLAAVPLGEEREEAVEEETVDDRSGWILEQRGNRPNPLRRRRSKAGVIRTTAGAGRKV